jgi:subtilisin family serine protease
MTDIGAQTVTSQMLRRRHRSDPLTVQPDHWRAERRADPHGGTQLMTRLIRLLTILAALCGGAAFGVGSAGPAEAGSPAAPDMPTIRSADAPNALENRYIVVLRDRITRQSVKARADDLAGRYGANITGVYRAALRGFSATMSEQQARRLAAAPEVAYVEQDQTMTISADQQNPPSWGLDRIDERDLPTNQTYNYDTTAGIVTVYIIDTGIRISHNDFGGRARYGRDTVNEDNIASDCNGHGTHVAGTVGGTAHGVAKGVALVAVKVLNCEGKGTVSNIIQGVDWVTSNHVNWAVANMSLGGDGSDALDQAVRESIHEGIVYTVAAGNDDDDACDHSPARVSAAITAGATTMTDARWGDSNFGRCVDLFAPGVGIRSTWNSSDTATLGMTGTSMAAPHVAGGAALYLSKNPGAKPYQVFDHMAFDNASSGKVTDAGSGSPNRLLYRVRGPVITSLRCTSEHRAFRCSLLRSAGTPSSIHWYQNGTRNPHWDGDRTITRTCTVGHNVGIRVVLTDVPYGSVDKETRNLICRL